MFRAPPQAGGDRGAVRAAPPLHLSRGVAGAPSADAEAEAVGSGNLPALPTCFFDLKSLQSLQLKIFGFETRRPAVQKWMKSSWMKHL